MRFSVLAVVLGFAQSALADKGQASKEDLAALTKAAGSKLTLPPKAKGDLSDPDWIEISVKKGFCYTFEIKLAAGAKWKNDQQPDFAIDKWPDNRMSVGSELFGESGAIWAPPCATHTGKSKFGFMSYGPDSIAVGEGGYEFVVYERKGAADQLAKEVKIAKDAHAESIRERDALRAKTCKQCAGESVDPKVRKICLQRQGMTMSDCGW